MNYKNLFREKRVQRIKKIRDLGITQAQIEEEIAKVREALTIDNIGWIAEIVNLRMMIQEIEEESLEKEYENYYRMYLAEIAGERILKKFNK